jgi:hypothetical protein
VGESGAETGQDLGAKLVKPETEQHELETSTGGKGVKVPMEAVLTFQVKSA